MPYDLLIAGGRVFDPGQGIDGVMDIAIKGGRIAAIWPDLAAGEATRLMQLTPDRYVVPGLIDVHTHFMYGSQTPGVNWQAAAPDVAGVLSGVTTIVDAGTVGAWNFGIYPLYIQPTARTRTIAFLNIGRVGIVGQPLWLPDVYHPDEVDLDSTIKACAAHPESIKGIKLRLVGPVLAEGGEKLIALAKQAARETGLPMMVHIGDLLTKDTATAPGLTRALLRTLEPGDIVTHVCTAHPGGVLDANGRIIPELREAAERGVFFDPASGRNNFNADVCRRLADQGFHPDTISTDMSTPGRSIVVFSLMECISKFLALGYTFAQVIRMTTANAARVLGMEGEIGALAVGRVADITVLEIATGAWQFEDAWGQTFTGEQAIVPVQTIRAGEMVAPDWGPHPWGWLPREAGGLPQAEQ
jgi:dihydroorotase